MDNVRFNLTNDEKLAEAAGHKVNVGLGNNATTTAMNDKAKEIISKEESARLEAMAEEFNSNFENYEKQLAEAAKDISKVSNLEFKPIGNYLIVRPHKFNIFKKLERSASGIIIDGYYGMEESRLQRNSDTGEFEPEEQYIFTGTVEEVGPECKYVIPTDIVMWTKPSAIPLPVYNSGWILLNEARVMLTVNEKLEERFPKSPSVKIAEEAILKSSESANIILA